WARGRRAVHPCFYLVDAGVFRSLGRAGPLAGPEEVDGGALEGLVAQHLRAWIDYSGSDARLFYWKTRGGSEVDFVVYGPGDFWALEVKRGARVRRRDLRHLKTFRKDFPEARVRLAYGGDERLVSDGIVCLPVRELLPAIVPLARLP
ncbi:MAG: DUF4143 domain-containing protein, partial [Bryobacterales bacterium]|nr:DUF4143 domain-containing protein [Bryobacterales bacterium]